MNKLQDFKNIKPIGQQLFGKTNVADRKSDGTKWLLKDTTESWAINEYVTNKLYHHLFGIKNHDDVMFVNSGSKVLITTKYNDDIVEYKTLNDLPNYCALGGCHITENGVSSISKGSDSYYHGMPIRNTVEAIVYSYFLDDEDFTGFTGNIGFIKSGDEYHTHRFDFDDGLKFYDKLGVGILKGKYKQLEDYSGEKEYKPLSGSYIITHLKANSKFVEHSEGAIDKFIEVLKELLVKDREEIKKIISDAYEDVSEYFSNKTISKIFDLKKTNCFKDEYLPVNSIEKGLGIKPDIKCEYNKSDGAIEKITKFTTYMINKRFLEVKDTITCMQVEKALANNDIKFIKEATEAGELNGNTICTQFLNSINIAFIPTRDFIKYRDIVKQVVDIAPFKVMASIFKQQGLLPKNVDILAPAESQYLKNFAATYGYNNEAGKLLGDSLGVDAEFYQ